jgi:hypothetical protein
MPSNPFLLKKIFLINTIHPAKNILFIIVQIINALPYEKNPSIENNKSVGGG